MIGMFNQKINTYKWYLSIKVFRYVTGFLMHVRRIIFPEFADYGIEIAANEIYILAYTTAAHEIKRKKIWQAYTIASAGWVVAAVVVSVVEKNAN